MPSCTLELKAIPNAPRDEVAGWLGDALKVRVRAPALESRANEALCAFLAARLTRLPFLTSWYKGFRDQNLFKHVYNSVMARGDRVVAVSDQLAQLVNDRYGTPWEKLTVLPCGVDLDRFDPERMTQERIGTPSTCTVQAPHMAMPQPNFVPVRPIESRRTHKSGMSPSTSTAYVLPLTIRS